MLKMILPLIMMLLQTWGGTSIQCCAFHLPVYFLFLDRYDVAHRYLWNVSKANIFFLKRQHISIIKENSGYLNYLRRNKSLHGTIQGVITKISIL